MAVVLFLLFVVFSLTVLYRAMHPLIWEVGSAVYLIVATFIIGLPWFVGIVLWLAIGAIVVILTIDSIRASIADFLFQRAVNSIPKLSKTEEEALNAGDTWVEKDIFTDFARFQTFWEEYTKSQNYYISYFRGEIFEGVGFEEYFKPKVEDKRNDYFKQTTTLVSKFKDKLINNRLLDQDRLFEPTGKATDQEKTATELSTVI